MIVALALTGCQSGPSPARPHYVVGAPYRADGVWYYPRESFDFDETGLAVIAQRRAGEMTADGEAYDPTALTAAHPTLQLPAIVRITALANGRQVVVRLNDRPVPRGRLTAVTPHVAALVGIGAGPAPVRVEVMGAESGILVESLVGQPTLGIAAAPRGEVETTPLTPVRGAPVGVASNPSVSAGTTAAAGPRPPAPLTGEVTEVAIRPGLLWIDAGTFSDRRNAAERSARLPGFFVDLRRSAHDTIYRVLGGPYDDIRSADRALGAALAAGIVDARIVVE
jgi:rare lipoprotein A